MQADTEVRDWQGRQLIGGDGKPVGTIGAIYWDDHTGQPEWATVRTGFFGMRESFVPIAQASVEGETIRVPWDKQDVKDAPNVEPDADSLSQEQEERLYRHYGVGYSEARSESGLPEGRVPEDGAEHEVSGRAGDEAMTRSEEELRAGTRQRAAGTARLRKWVETEQVTERVPVQREEARVVREPITDDNVGRAMGGPEISEAEHEVPLMEEEVVVEKRAVPKERVRLEKDTITEEQEVSEELRKERIEAEGDNLRDA